MNRTLGGKGYAVLSLAVALVACGIGAAGCEPTPPSSRSGTPPPASTGTKADSPGPTAPTAAATAVATPASPLPSEATPGKTTSTEVACLVSTITVGGSVDARKVVLSEADLGPKWVRDAASEPASPDARHASTSFRWEDPSGRPGAEGLAAISSRVVVYPDGAAARAELKPLPPDCRPISAPSVGDSSRAYTRSVAPDLRAVYLEAVAGNVWLQVGVTGSPRSEVKITRAAELARSMVSRLATSRTLTVEEYPIVARSVDSPGRIEYSRRIDPRVLEKRKAWRTPDPEARLAAANRSLAPFGYRLVGNERSDHPAPLYNLYRGETLILRDLTYMGPVSVSARGDDFTLVVETRQSGEFLIRPSGVEKWDSMEHAFTRPVFVDNDLVTLDLKEDHGLRVFGIVRAGRPVYASVVARGPVDEPIKGLGAWDGHWVLEIDGKLLVDGKSLNEEMGYEEVFGWRLLAGQPFYFFKQGGRIGVSYGGDVLPHRYDEVIHYKCCEPAAFNVAGNETMVWFHGLKDGTWHYVEMGVYEQAASPRPGPGAGTPSPPTAVPTPHGPGMRLSEGTPALSTGSLEQAQKATGVPARIPRYLPTGAVQDGPVRYYATGTRAVVSIGYRVDRLTMAVEYLKPPSEEGSARKGRPVMVGGLPATVYTQPREPSDPLPPVNEVSWQDGQVTVRIRGDLSVEELLKVAQSLY